MLFWSSLKQLSVLWYPLAYQVEVRTSFWIQRPFRRLSLFFHVCFYLQCLYRSCCNMPLVYSKNFQKFFVKLLCDIFLLFGFSFLFGDFHSSDTQYAFLYFLIFGSVFSQSSLTSLSSSHSSPGSPINEVRTSKWFQRYSCSCCTDWLSFFSHRIVTWNMNTSSLWSVPQSALAISSLL